MPEVIEPARMVAVPVFALGAEVMVPVVLCATAPSAQAARMRIWENISSLEMGLGGLGKGWKALS